MSIIVAIANSTVSIIETIVESNPNTYRLILLNIIKIYNIFYLKLLTFII